MLKHKYDRLDRSYFRFKARARYSAYPETILCGMEMGRRSLPSALTSNLELEAVSRAERDPRMRDIYLRNGEFILRRSRILLTKRQGGQRK